MVFLVLIIVVVVVLVAALLLRGGGSWLAQTKREDDEVVDSPTPTLDYQVGEGQDAAAVSAALTNEGLTVAPDPHHPILLHVECPAGQDRERARVRAIIAGALEAQTGHPVDVRFQDEV